MSLTHRCRTNLPSVASMYRMAPLAPSRLTWRGLRPALAVAALLAAVSPALAQAPSEPEPTVSEAASSEPAPPVDAKKEPFPLDHEHPERSVPSRALRDADPIRTALFMLELSIAADDAMAEKDYRSAVKYYGAFAKGTPEQANGFSKLCEAHEALGEWGLARAACAAALSRAGVTLGDYLRTLRLSLADQATPLSEGEVADLDAIIEHLKGEPAAEEAVNFFPCDLALRLNDTGRLQACVQHLREKAPNTRRTLVYEWTLALRTRDFDQARALIEQARTTGAMNLGSQKLAEMRLATDQAERETESQVVGKWALAAAVALAFGLVALGVGALLRRRQRPPAITT